MKNGGKPKKTTTSTPSAARSGESATKPIALKLVSKIRFTNRITNPCSFGFADRITIISRAFLQIPDFWRKTAETVGVRGYTVLAQLCIVAVTANVFGPSGRGTIAAATSWTLLFATLAGLSLGQAVANLAAQGRFRFRIGTLLGTLIFATVLATATCWMLVAAFLTTVGHKIFGGLDIQTIVAALSALPFLIWQQYQLQLLIALGELDRANRAYLLGRTASVLAVGFSIAAFNPSVDLVLVAIALGEACLAAVGFRLLLRRAGTGIRPTWTDSRLLITRGLLLHPNAAGALLMTTSQIVIIHHFWGDTETGIYQLAAFSTDALALASGAATLVVYDRLAAKGPDGSWQDSRRILRGITTLTMACALAAALLSPLLIPVIFGHRFLNSVPLLLMLLPTLLGRLMQNMLAPQWVGRGLLWQFSAANLALGLLNVALCFVLVPSLGSLGAVIASNVTYGLLALLNITFAVWIERRWRALPE